MPHESIHIIRSNLSRKRARARVVLVPSAKMLGTKVVQNGHQTVLIALQPRKSFRGDFELSCQVGFEFRKDEGELVFCGDVCESVLDEYFATGNEFQDTFKGNFVEFAGGEEIAAILVKLSETGIGLSEQRFEGEFFLNEQNQAKRRSVDSVGQGIIEFMKCEALRNGTMK